MTAAGRAAQDRGTRYVAALNDAPGTSRDERLMAYLCEYVIYTAAPGLNPRLVWEGARAAGLTNRDLKALANRRDWNKIEAFMWAALDAQ